MYGWLCVVNEDATGRDYSLCVEDEDTTKFSNQQGNAIMGFEPKPNVKRFEFAESLLLIRCYLKKEKGPLSKLLRAQSLTF